MSVELWKSIFNWLTIVLIAFTVFSGAGALITGDIINSRQSTPKAPLHATGGRSCKQGQTVQFDATKGPRDGKRRTLQLSR
jgi:hypothetical protein